MFPWKITINIKDDKNQKVKTYVTDEKYFATIDEAKSWGSTEAFKLIELSKRTDLWYTVEVE